MQPEYTKEDEESFKKALEKCSELTTKFMEFTEGMDIRQVILASIYFTCDTAIEMEMSLKDLLEGVISYYHKIKTGEENGASTMGNGESGG